MQRALPIGLALAALAFVAAAGAWAACSDAPWFDATARALSLGLGLLGATALVLVICDRPGPRVVLVLLMMAMVPVARVAERVRGDFAWLQWERGPIADVTACVATLAAIGLLRRWSWARWGVLAGGACGVASMLLNGIGSLSAPDMSTWSYANEAGICLILLALMMGPTMAGVFMPAAESPWASRDPLVRGLRWTIGSSVAAIAMLGIYALAQPVVPATANAALSLAGVLALAILLCTVRSLAGAMVLVLAGSGLLVLTATTVVLAHRTGDALKPWIASYYAAFWVPAGVISLATGVAMLRPLRALWRRTA